MRGNFTIFLLLIGIALLDANRGGHWFRVVFWLAAATLFLFADLRPTTRAR